MNGDVGALIAIVPLLAALLHWLPLWRRRNLWFGVTVAPGFDATPEARAVLRTYRTAVWMLSLVAISGVALGVRLGLPALLPAGVAILGVGASVAFAVVRRRIRPFAVQAGARSAVLSPRHEGLPGGAAAVIVPLGMLTATAFYLHANWLRLPERFPVHWSLDGTPNGWTERTWHGVYGPLAACAFMTLFLLLVAEAIIHASPRARVAGTEEWTTRFRRANLVLLVAGVWGLSALTCLLWLMPLFPDAARLQALVWMIPAVLVLSIAPFLWQLIRVMREPGSGSDGTPDECWKFGLIYYNPADPAVMVEKRFGVGYTVNFGNNALWWILGVAVVLILIVKGVG